jgi:hypothetical protein
MRPFSARRLALAALAPALFVLSVIPGCSNESEGERCGDDTGVTNNDDCGSGLVCTAFPLNDGSGKDVGRCCYTDHVTDSRCLTSNGTSATGGASSNADDAGAAAGEAGSRDAITTGGGGGAMLMTVDLPAGAGGA